MRWRRSRRGLGAILGGGLAGAALLGAAIGVPLFFANSGWIAGRLERLLRIQVDPSFTGGALVAEFPDPLGDDAGPGGYEYPLGQGWERGELDLARYAVRAPVTRPVWGPEGAYWQLEASFAKAASTGLGGGGFRAPVLHVYICIGGAEARESTESAFGEGELLRFDPSHPWDYVVSADGWSPSGEIRSADGAYRAPVETAWDLARRRLTLRIGLRAAPPLLASVIAGRPTWHYVLVGAFDPAREGHFAALREVATLHDGGGAADELCPRAFDLIAPRGRRQAAELSSQDAAAGKAALVFPVQAGGDEPIAADPGLRARAEAAAADEAAAAEAARAARLRALPPESAADASLIGELFELGLEERCLAAIASDLAAKADDPPALAYRGAIVARRADRAAGLGEKMRLVAEAYRDLDAAVALSARSPRADGRVAALLCRGSVSSAVPNDVFGRAAQGAADFAAAGALAAAAGDSALEAACLADAAAAYDKAGMGEEAAARWATLAEMRRLGGSLRLRLLERGYPTED
jgi:hypothetical protein